MPKITSIQIVVKLDDGEEVRSDKTCTKDVKDSVLETILIPLKEIKKLPGLELCRDGVLRIINPDYIKYIDVILERS